MRKFTIAGLAITLALILGLDTPRPVAAAVASTAACLRQVTYDFDRARPLMHKIFLLAAKKVCEESGNTKVAKRFVTNYKLTVSSNWVKLSKAHDSFFTGKKNEPGLLDMAEPMLREAAGAEAQALLAAEAARIAAEAAKTTSSPTPGTAAEEEPAPPGTIVLGPTVTISSQVPGDPVKVYEDRFIQILGNNPDMALGIKLGLYRSLVRIATAGARTDGERRFLTKMQGYIRQMNIRVAQSALDAYDVWDAGEGSKPPNSKLMVLVDYGTVPPDFHKLAGAAIMGSAVAIGTAGAIAAGALITTSTTATAAGAGIGLSTLMGASGTSGLTATAGVTAGAIAGPVVIVVAALVAIGVSAYQINRITKARPKLEKHLKKSKENVNVGKMLNTPEGTTLVQYFLAKATSDYSPTGLKAGNTGCQACFYEHADFQGKSFCTTGRVNNLKRQIVKGSDFNFGDEITSVKIEDNKCQGAYVRLFEHDKMRGKILTLTRSHPNITAKARGGGNWNDKASSLEFIDKGAPRCEVCIHKDPDYKGGYYCAQGPINDLKSFGWGDKASAIAFNISGCPKGKVWLYEHKDFKGRYIALKSNHNNFKRLEGGGRGEWNDDVSSLYFSPEGVNTFAQRQVGGCRVCLYENTGYEGRWVCVGANSQNAELKSKDIDLNDKATAIDFLTKQCPRGQSLVATLYQHTNFKGKELAMDHSDPNFGRLSRGGKNWNDTVSAVKVKMVPTRLLNCRVCLYEADNYGGKSVCGFVDENLKNNDLNDKASSVKIFKNACPQGGVTLYEDDGHKGRTLQLMNNVPRLRNHKRGNGNWNDKITSFRFDDKMAQRQGCQVCLYEHTSYRGEKFCTDRYAEHLRPYKLNDKTSSIRLFNSSCPNAGVTVYEHGKWGGKFRELTSSTPNVGRDWNDKITGVRFNPSLKLQIATRCEVCVFEHANYQGKAYCTSGRIEHLKNAHPGMNDKTTSVRLFTGSCPNAGVTLYEHGDYKGGKLELTRSTSNVGRNWNDKITGVIFDRSLKTKIARRASCRVCLYEHTGYRGQSYCTNGTVEHLNNIRPKFNDKTSSIKIFDAGCRDAGVTVYEHGKFGGKTGRYIANTANVGGNWNDKITGVKFSKTLKATIRAERARAARRCRVCFYEHKDFKGRYVCTSSVHSNLKNLRAGHRSEWNDDISSLKVDVPACRGSSVTIYEHTGYGGKRVTLTAGNYSNLHNLNRGGRKWGDSISSLKFNKVTAAQAAAAAERAKDAAAARAAAAAVAGRVPGRCGVCVYEHVDYKGKYVCTGGAYPNLVTLNSGGRTEWNDDISSIQVVTVACPLGAVTIYEHTGYRGKSTRLKRSHNNLHNLNAGGRKWGDAISSLKFKRVSGFGPFGR